MEIFWQLVLAAVLGGLVGLEREYKRKEAGLRTYALVCLGAALFTVIAFETLGFYINHPGANFDPTRIIGQIVLGVGFLGAGLIVYREFRLEGLTTAAGLWVVAGIGAAVGVKLYLIAVFTTGVAILVLATLRKVEKKLFPKEDEEP